MLRTLFKIYKNTPNWLISSITIGLICYASLDSNPLNINSLTLFKGADKIIHLIMYFILYLTLILDYSKTQMPHHIKLNIEAAICFASIAFGLLMEVLQGHITEYRSFDILDIAFNTAGAIIAFITVKFWIMHKFRRYMVPFYIYAHSKSHHKKHHRNN